MALEQFHLLIFLHKKEENDHQSDDKKKIMSLPILHIILVSQVTLKYFLLMWCLREKIIIKCGHVQ